MKLWAAVHARGSGVWRSFVMGEAEVSCPGCWSGIRRLPSGPDATNHQIVQNYRIYQISNVVEPNLLLPGDIQEKRVCICVYCLSQMSLNDSALLDALTPLKK